MVTDQPAREADEVAAKVVSHGRYVTFQMAEVAVSRPVADRPAANTTRLGMSGQREQMRQVTTAEVRLAQSEQPGSALQRGRQAVPTDYAHPNVVPMETAEPSD